MVYTKVLKTPYIIFRKAFGEKYLGTKLKMYSITLSILAVFIFDYFIASSSVMPFRFIYDIAFMIIFIPVIFTSITLITGKEFPLNNYFLTIKNHNISTFLPIIFLFINLKAIIAIVQYDLPIVGFLDRNILIESSQSIVPVIEYLIIILVNGLLLYSVFNKKTDIYLYEIPTYALGIIALESCLALYSYHFGGLFGLRLGLSLFHIVLSSLAIWLAYNGTMKAIHLKISTSDVLLTLFSIGILIMVFTPFGIYNQFHDNAIIINSAISITQRGSIQPYYSASNYYTPIGSFSSLVFAFLTGLTNVLQFSSLPFLVSYILLPFATFQFLKIFVVDDERIAILGTIVTIFMDGLAIILLPAYIGDLTYSILSLTISPATSSLRFSSIQWFWLTPYKILGMAAAIASCNMFHRKSRFSLILGGGLFFLSFVNPRQPFLVLLLLIFLFGTKKIDLKEIVTLFLVMMTCLGPLLTIIISKFVTYAVWTLNKIGFISTENADIYISNILTLISNEWLSVILVSISVISAFIFIRLTSKEKNIKNLTTQYVSRKFSGFNFKLKLRGLQRNWSISLRKFSGLNFKLKLRGLQRNWSISFEEIVLLSLSILMIIYLYFQAYQTLPLQIINIFQLKFIRPLNYVIQRYHILIVLVVLGFFVLKYNKRVSLTFISLSLLTYFMVLFSWIRIKPLLHTPLIIVIMALPAFASFVKSYRKLGTFLIVFMIILGLFSAGMFSSTVKSPNAEPKFLELPYVLNILLTSDNDGGVFSPSESYIVRRTVKMANLNLTTEPSWRLCLIDIAKTNSSVIDSYHDNYEELYHGEAFLLVERVYNSKVSPLMQSK